MRPSVVWAITGLRSQPNGKHGHTKCFIRNMPSASWGIFNDQKKFVRSMVVAHSVDGGKRSMMLPISSSRGSVNLGLGSRESAFTPLRSAMKAAFSLDFGRRKALLLDGVRCCKCCGKGKRNWSLWRAWLVIGFGSRGSNGAFGVKVWSLVTNSGGTNVSQMSFGMGKEPHLPRPF